MEPTSRAKLPRSARLRGHDAFGRLFREGEGLRRGELVLKYLASDHPEGNVHAGFVVRRNAGSAVRRNRLRRLLREAYRRERSGFVDTLPGGITVDMVILWSGTPEGALRPSFEAISAQMKAALGALSSRLRKRADGSREQR
jgi:ribonuclease P protein component